MFEPDDPEEELPEPVFYAEGRRGSSPGPRSLARRFVYIAGPLWETARDPGEAQAALDVAHMAWNLTRLPEPMRTERIGQAVRNLVQHTGQAADFSDILVRATRWPEDRRFVADVSLTELSPGEWHVGVSMLTPAELSRRISSQATKPRAPRRGSRP